MAVPYFYTKTIDSGVQGGEDTSLILSAYQSISKPFSFGSDWTKIKIGMFWSYTNSVTDDNKAFVSEQADVNSGATSNDTYSWFGIINDTVDKGIPLSDGINFAGARFHLLDDIASNTGNSRYNKVADNSSYNNRAARYMVTKDTSIVKASYSAFTNTGGAFESHIPFINAANTTSFSGYIGIQYEVFNRGLSNQYIRISQSKPSGSDWEDAPVTDVSLTNLKNIMAGSGEWLISLWTTSSNYEFTWNDGVSAYPLPDSIFFYNAFLTVRPRIHAIAVKKIR